MKEEQQFPLEQVQEKFLQVQVAELALFYFIGNSDFLNRKKKRMFVEHTLDKGKKGILD